MITMSRGSDSRWYEPPPPRSWKTNTSSLQRIESAENLRKALLDSAAKATGVLPHRKSYRPQTRTMNRSFDYDRTKSMSSLPSTPLALRGSLSGSAKLKIDASRLVQQSLTKQLSGSARDLSSSSSGFLTKLKTQENAEKILTNTPPSRPRTTTLTRFRPLPAIKHSAGSTRSDPTNINNNTGEIKHPPPLLRSRTFDVIETNLDNLPVVDDDDDDRSYTGSDDDDDDDDDQSDSGSDSDSDSGKDSDSNASDSGVVSAESNRNREAQARKEQREAIFERSLLNGAIPVQTVTVTIEGKLISEYASQTKMGAIRSRPFTQHGRDAAVNSSASSPSDNSDDSDEESSGSDNSESENEEEEGEEEEDEGDGGDDDEEEGEDETSRVGATLPDIFEDEETFTAVDGGIEEDIIVYVKMPDDTLMLASSPKERTLRELLTIIKDTHIHGSCLVISRKGLTANELDKTLEELGIYDNTTLHLIAEWPLEKGP
ncbi:uncharacterized protein [Palaemon carinicauda]|uniref:uncharacterized protein n=1 Tax=Palaemon carinicauda TaxID=392227 RepID=UPI0035B5EF1A